ncbi:MAG: hypothetical protein KJ831_08555, partial [Candidatus Eisenbacteria bacterium]|nr:hypothetical protein [Candidatus Eisenbacteria bacterium]
RLEISRPLKLPTNELSRGKIMISIPPFRARLVGSAVDSLLVKIHTGVKAGRREGRPASTRG